MGLEFEIVALLEVSVVSCRAACSESRVWNGKVGNRKSTFVTAAMNVNSEIGWSDLLENVMDKVMIDGDCGSRAAWSEMLSAVSLTCMVFAAGRPSGNAEEKAQSSSSGAFGARGAA